MLPEVLAYHRQIYMNFDRRQAGQHKCHGICYYLRQAIGWQRSITQADGSSFSYL